jgi:hypothetical protein
MDREAKRMMTHLKSSIEVKTFRKKVWKDDRPDYFELSHAIGPSVCGSRKVPNPISLGLVMC